MSNRTAPFFVKLSLAATVLVLTVPAHADRVILTPSPTALLQGSYRAEALQSLGENPESNLWAAGGTQYAELEIAGFHRPRHDSAALSVSTQILPQTDYFPAVAIGVRDITDSTIHDRGPGYRGRSVFIVGGRTPTELATVAFPFRNLSYSLGLGEGGIKGPFGSVSAELLPKVRWAAEWDSHVFNEKLSLILTSSWQINAERIGKSTLIGAEYNTPITIF